MIKVSKLIDDYEIVIESDSELSIENLSIIFNELFPTGKDTNLESFTLDENS